MKSRGLVAATCCFVSLTCSSSFLLPFNRLNKFQLNLNLRVFLSSFSRSSCSWTFAPDSNSKDSISVKGAYTVTTALGMTDFASVSSSTLENGEEGSSSGLLDIGKNEFEECENCSFSNKNGVSTIKPEVSIVSEQSMGGDRKEFTVVDGEVDDNKKEKKILSTEGSSTELKLVAPYWVNRVNRALGKSGRDPTCKYLQLATVSYNKETEEFEPSVRTVVFRGFMDGSKTNILKFITDFRSEKVNQISRNNVGEVAWYFTKTREQFRIKGHLVVVGDVEETSNDPEDIEPVTGFTFRYLQGKRKEQWNNLSNNAKLQFWWPDPGSPQPPDIDVSLFSSPPQLLKKDQMGNSPESNLSTETTQEMHANKENSSSIHVNEEETNNKKLDEDGIEFPSLPPSTFMLVLFNPYFVDYLDLRASPQCRIQFKQDLNRGLDIESLEKNEKKLYADPRNLIISEEIESSLTSKWTEQKVNP